MEHSPTPWATRSTDSAAAILDARGEQIARLPDAIFEKGVARVRLPFRKNAHHIILCVNAHDKLVAACEAGANLATMVRREFPGYDAAGEHVQQLAQAALAQLE